MVRQMDSWIKTVDETRYFLKPQLYLLMIKQMWRCDSSHYSQLNGSASFGRITFGRLTFGRQAQTCADLIGEQSTALCHANQHNYTQHKGLICDTWHKRCSAQTTLSIATLMWFCASLCWVPRFIYCYAEYRGSLCIVKITAYRGHLLKVTKIEKRKIEQWHIT